MTKFFKPLPLLLFLIVSYSLTAQVSKPVQFSFSANHDDSGAFISIKAKIADNIRLFSIEKKTAEDVFFSRVEFDSSAGQYLKDSLTELGNVKTSHEAAAGGKEVRYFSDSVEWRQKLNISSNDSTRIKGKVTWLAANGD